jgi:hypothetical protein
VELPAVARCRRAGRGCWPRLGTPPLALSARPRCMHTHVHSHRGCSCLSGSSRRHHGKSSFVLPPYGVRTQASRLTPSFMSKRRLTESPV